MLFLLLGRGVAPTVRQSVSEHSCSACMFLGVYPDLVSTEMTQSLCIPGDLHRQEDKVCIPGSHGVGGR